MTLTLAMAMAGCETEVLSPHQSNADAELSAFFGPERVEFTRTRDKGAAAHSATAAQPAATGLADAQWDDSCAVNLDEMTGALLMYYSTHQQLPPTLESIPKVSPSGAKISLTCPASGKRYVYHPEGLKPPLFTDQEGQSHVGGVLVLYDPEPSHQTVQHLTNGTDDFDVTKKVHLGIVLEPRGGGPNAPIQMSVERIEPGILEMYLRHNPKAAPAPAAPPVAPVW
jgi:hypothetical protein